MYIHKAVKAWAKLCPGGADIFYIRKLKWPDLALLRNIHWILWKTLFQDIILEITGNGSLCRRVICFSFRIRIFQVFKCGTEIARLGWIHCSFTYYIRQGDIAHPATEKTVLHHLGLMVSGALNNAKKAHKPMTVCSVLSLKIWDK